MDRRDIGPQESGYMKELKESGDDGEYDEYTIENGEQIRTPYKIIKEVVFSNIRKEDFVDSEHAARLQYRLMLLDAVLKAKVEYVKGRITIRFNPKDAKNRKVKTDVNELEEFLAKEGINVDKGSVEVKDYDYYSNFYKYAFNPPEIREHPPYGVTREQWKEQKKDWEKKVSETNAKKREKFLNWQLNYARDHTGTNLGHSEEELGLSAEKKQIGILAKIFGKKNEKKGKDKEFWFHGA